MAVQVANVKLPQRTQSRLEAESSQNRALKPHDIRMSIPMVDYTNPAKFPPYVFREYPKMPLLDNNRPIIINESGDVLIFYEAVDEVEFKEMNPDVADEIDRNTPAKQIASVIAAQEETIEDLRARLRAAGLADGPVRKAGATPKNALAGLTGPKVAPLADEPTEMASEAPNGGLASQIKAAEAEQAPTPKAEGGKPNPLKKKN